MPSVIKHQYQAQSTRVQSKLDPERPKISASFRMGSSDNAKMGPRIMSSPRKRCMTRNQLDLELESGRQGSSLIPRSKFKMKSSTAVLPILAAVASAKPVQQRQSCPGVYVFGARETTAPAGYGTSGGLVNMVTAAYPDSQSSAIDYPACGGQAECGGIDYDSSANQGTTAVVSAVNDLNSQCPDTKIVLIGYSQGGQIMDNALCGGAGETLSGAALDAVKAAIFMGDPHNIAGLPYNVGTCTAGG
ncbi:hypothetical protein EKO27_g5440, partial [Xylaria grammica]